MPVHSDMQTHQSSTAQLTEEIWMQQLEELIALSTILPEEDFRLSEIPGTYVDTESRSLAEVLEELYAQGCPDTPGLISCEINAHVLLPPGGLQLLLPPVDRSHNSLSNGTHTKQTQVQSQQSAQGSSTQQIETPQGDGQQSTAVAASGGKRIHHLPPIRLQLTFPHDYPSESQPQVQAWAIWLGDEQTQRIQSALVEQWNTQGPGSPICYQWLEWLRESALQHLGITDNCTMTLQSAQTMSNSNGAQPGTSSQEPTPHSLEPEQLALILLRYSAHREQEQFQTELVTCPVCFDEVSGAKCVRLPDCGHHTCQQCFAQHCRTKVQDGEVDAIRCVIPDCGQLVPSNILRSVLTEQDYTRWENLLLQRTLDKMDDVVYCPRCHSVSLEDKEHCAQCSKCFYVFCGACDDAWHPGSACVSPDQVLERKRERLERSGNMSNEEKLRRHADLVGQYKSVASILSSSKQCPVCKMAIQKTEGCNKMMCTACGTKFCFRCLRVIDDYSHFGEGKCELFEAEDIALWEEQVANLGDRYYHVVAAGFMVQEAVRDANRRGQRAAVRLSPCPTCGQMNMKTSNNNLIRCYACNSSYCYLCREHLRQKPGLHFGAGKRCKQHTDN